MKICQHSPACTRLTTGSLEILAKEEFDHIVAKHLEAVSKQ